MHVVCAWIGNTRKVAAEHYLQVTQEHFEQAAHNPAQYTAEQGAMEEKANSDDVTQTAGFTEDTSKFCSVQKLTMGRAGFEPA